MNDAAPPRRDAPAFLAEGGQMGALMRTRDWNASPLGPAPAWPAPLRTLVPLMLGSRQPMFVAWGEQGTLLYNDGYADILGRKHPAALGAPFFDVWSEIRPEIEPLFEQALGGGSVHMDDLTLVMDRHGRPEETHFAFSYTPVRDEDGAVAGIFCACTETTGRVATERALRESEDHYRHTVELNPQVTWTSRPDGQLDHVARRWFEWTGTSGLGESWGAAIHPDDLGPTVEAWRRSVTTGAPYDIEHRVRLRDGEYRWMRSRGFPRRDSDGRIVKWYGSTEDIHDRKLAGDLLRESEARFRNMADHAPVKIWITDPDGNCTYLSRRWYQFTGQTTAEALGLGWTKATHPDDEARARDAFLAANAARGPFQVEYRLRRADGVYRWAIDTAAPRFGPGGEFLGYVGSVIDIDDRRDAALRLKISEESLRLATEAAEVGTWDLNLATEVLTWSDRTKAAFGISPDVPCSMADFYAGLHPEDREATGEAFASALDPARRATYDVEYRTIGREDGLIRWVAAKGRGLFDDRGRCYRAIGTAIDITARKAIEDRLRASEAELRELNETLEHRVEERTRELQAAEEQLRQAQKMEAVGQLTGGIAHDFNNLLTGIVGSLDLMLTRIAQGRSEHVERYAKAAMSSANRAAALTHRLLAFARRQPLDPKPVNVNQLVASMEDLLRRSLGEAIEMEIVTAGGLWMTLCDPHQLESAILNLAINARDAMPEGGKLTIETANSHLDDAYAAAQREVTPGQYVAICVTDTGGGMPPELIARAFDPFFTTKPIGQGTGLGLSMVYGFAKQSEGHARIYSEVGQGTTVRIYLPRHRGIVGEDASPSDPIEPPRAEAGETVLVVEDEPVVRNLVVEVLQDLGYRALEAADGPAGLKILQSKRRIDLLISDVGLPGLNGRQMADQARERRPGLKILFITGYAENATMANGFLDPGMEMITKPFAIEALATRIRAIIKRG